MMPLIILVLPILEWKEFTKKFNVIGYDINSKRVTDLNLGD